MGDKRRAKWLKVGLFVAILGVNIPVSIIWTRARLPSATSDHVRLNNKFEIFNKTFFLAIDLVLNLYFIFLVRFSLIALDLNQYWVLFKVNIGIVGLCLGLDACVLGMLKLPNTYV